MRGETPRDVIVALDWNLGRLFQRIVIPNEAPLDIELRYLAGLNVTLVHRTSNSARALMIAKAILDVRPRLFNMFNVEVPCNVIVKSASGEIYL